MTRSSTSATLASVLMLLGGVALAGEPLAVKSKSGAETSVGSSAKPSQGAWDHRLRLVRQLLAQGTVAQRIEHSNNGPAKKLLADAQALYGKAQLELGAGRAGTAIHLLDDALRQIAAASSLVPDLVLQEARERQQNQQLRAAIVAFQAQQRSRAGRSTAGADQSEEVGANMGRIDAMLARADGLLAMGEQGEASQVLSNAYKIAVMTLNKMLASETIVYSLKFDTPADEFQHELARNQSYEELIPIALIQLNVARETAVLAERYVRQSRELRDAAQRRASSGDYAAALKALQDATGHLQHSLRIAGVIVPQSPESKP